MLLRLTTRSGAQGIAEVTAIPNVADSDALVLQAQFERFFRPLLTGADAFDHDGLLAAFARVRGASIAKALIETALWDLKGKVLGEPVWRLLGDAAPAPVPVTAILFGDTSEAMLADAERTAARGIRSLKVKLWRHSPADIELVRDIRRAVGDGVLIYADANHAYSEAEARELLPKLAEYGVPLIEDPCDIPADRLARLNRDLPLGVLGEIPIDSLATAQRYVDANALGAVSVHPRRTGIAESVRIAALAQTAGIPPIVGTDLESGLGALVRLHLHAGVPALAAWPAEVQFFERLADEVLAEPLAIVEGAIAVADRPGFGGTVDEAKLARYRVSP